MGTVTNVSPVASAQLNVSPSAQLIDSLKTKNTVFSVIQSKNKSTGALGKLCDLIKNIFTYLHVTVGFGRSSYAELRSKINFTENFDKTLAKAVDAVAKRTEALGAYNVFVNSIDVKGGFERATDAEKKTHTELFNQKNKTQATQWTSVEKLVKLITTTTAFTLEHSVEDYKAALKTLFVESQEAAELIDETFISSSLEEKKKLITQFVSNYLNFSSVDATQITDLIARLAQMTVQNNDQFVVESTDSALKTLDTRELVTNYYTNKVVHLIGGQDAIAEMERTTATTSARLDALITELNSTKKPVENVPANEDEVKRLLEEAKEKYEDTRTTLTKRIAELLTEVPNEGCALITVTHSDSKEAPPEELRVFKRIGLIPNLENNIKTLEDSINDINVRMREAKNTIPTEDARITQKTAFAGATALHTMAAMQNALDERTDDLNNVSAQLGVFNNELAEAQKAVSIPFDVQARKALITKDQEEIETAKNAAFNATIDAETAALEAQVALLGSRKDGLVALGAIEAPETKTVSLYETDEAGVSVQEQLALLTQEIALLTKEIALGRVDIKAASKKILQLKGKKKLFSANRPKLFGPQPKKVSQGMKEIPSAGSLQTGRNSLFEKPENGFSMPGITLGNIGPAHPSQVPNFKLSQVSNLGTLDRARTGRMVSQFTRRLGSAQAGAANAFSGAVNSLVGLVTGPLPAFMDRTNEGFNFRFLNE